VDADRILIEGDDYFRAIDNVEIRRETMQAFGDSVARSASPRARA
jgi:hypothetical protein